MERHTQDDKLAARSLFLKGWKVPEIEADTGINRRNIYRWIAREQWEVLFAGETAIAAAQRRWLCLLDKEGKTEDDFKEMGFLVNQMDKLERIEQRRIRAAKAAEAEEAYRARQGRGSPSGGGGGSERRSGGGSGGPKNNDFRDVCPQAVLEHLKDGLFAYQVDLWEHKNERIRDILKARQIGLTWYFAREAFADALLSGDNQVFLSASRNQADVFRDYIKAFAYDWFGVEVKGKDKIVLQTPNGTATLYFLSTNSSTAQSYHGHVYVDEFFWIPNFGKLNKVASAMAAHKNWRKTYFSTPSAKSHDAYPFWSGDLFNDRNKRAGRKLTPFPSKEQLRKAGVRCPDGQWRRVITLADAEAAGCDLFDSEQLKLEYSEAEFKQLFDCCFMDDTGSVFRLSQLEHCVVDTAKWKDVDYSARPAFLGPVWIGYDPARHHDGGAVVVNAPPQKIMGKFRVVEKLILRGMPWPEQARVIEELTKTYNVEYIGIDRTGPGDGVFEMVQAFFPRAVGIYYTPELKTRLVIKAQQIVADKRVEYDAIHSDITAGFMQIKRGLTPSGGKITYTCDRNDKTGHADAAWALMHTLINEGLVEPDQKRTAVVTFSD